MLHCSQLSQCSLKCLDFYQQHCEALISHWNFHCPLQSSKIIPFNSDRCSDILVPSELFLWFFPLCMQSRLCLIPAYLEAHTPARHQCSSSAEITASKQKPYHITSVEAKIDKKINRPVECSMLLSTAFRYSFEALILHFIFKAKYDDI